MLSDKLERLATADWSVDEMIQTIESVVDQLTMKGEEYLIICTMLNRLKERANKVSELEQKIATLEREQDVLAEVQL